MAILLTLKTPSVTSLLISQDTIETTEKEALLSNLTVNPGVYYLLLNNRNTVITGSFENAGNFHVLRTHESSTNIMVTSKSFQNKGTVVFDSTAAVGGEEYRITVNGAFENSGRLYWGISNAWVSGTPFSIRSKASWTNTGRIMFERTSGPAVRVAIDQGLGSRSRSVIKNTGVICLTNTVWTQTTDIKGDGCIYIGRGAKLALQAEADTASFFVSSGQVIYLAQGSSTLEFSGLRRNPGASFSTYKIAGFGGNNVIRFDVFFWGYSYNGETGVLTVKYKDMGVNFDIGKDYLPFHFAKTTSLTGISLSYRQNPPNDVPSKCFCGEPSEETSPLSTLNFGPKPWPHSPRLWWALL
ncbi:hypothetical protein JCM33374_g1440 [Metschnikowia sp. JCM 33374]|nr:hypothetical protein JCM33374_g1440 [Metschnikowia sp. JCM 33374]